MIWIIVVIIGIIILFNISKNSRNKKLEEVLIKRLEKIIFGYYGSQEEINQLSKDIFIYCLNKSNKDISFEEISSLENLVRNLEVLDYLSLYKSLKETIQLATEKSNKIQVLDTYQTAQNTFKVLTNFTTSKINKI
ncbi:hypothetical protein ETU10_08735 [Apibacter muscae]|uniref:hypothetical protein n=1 Tax=Apibacter muscae TaxID=2509004 RepID=UPI0011ABC938|nr:hypothetical protein [Apibacter muscae]TWP23171.1 hypothetical protein ETU10_08735 [Apibacter muscae]